MTENGIKRVVCIGDSITRAQISVDYVEMLRRRFADSQVTFVNAGVNFDTSFSLLDRLDDVIALQPDMVTVLVGTNDVNATLSPKNSRLYQRQKKLPVAPSPDLYQENLTAIVRKLTEHTHAKVALLSLPVIGEVLDSIPVIRTVEYSAIVRDVATMMAWLTCRYTSE